MQKVDKEALKMSVVYFVSYFVFARIWVLLIEAIKLGKFTRFVGCGKNGRKQ